MILFGKAILIAGIATIASWLPVAILMSLIDGTIDPSFAMKLLPIALFGCFALGLPISLLVYNFFGHNLTGSPRSIMWIAMLAGFISVLFFGATAGTFGMVFLGVPSLIAALCFGAFGWLWVLKPKGGKNSA